MIQMLKLIMLIALVTIIGLQPHRGGSDGSYKGKSCPVGSAQENCGLESGLNSTQHDKPDDKEKPEPASDGN